MRAIDQTRAAKGEIIGLLVLLDDAFERAVGHVGIAGPKEQQCGQRPRQTTVAILEGWISRKTTTKTATISVKSR